MAIACSAVVLAAQGEQLWGKGRDKNLNRFRENRRGRIGDRK